MVIRNFREGIRPKVNVIACLEIELVYYDVAVQHINHYAPVIVAAFDVIDFFMYPLRCLHFHSFFGSRFSSTNLPSC